MDHNFVQQSIPRKGVGQPDWQYPMFATLVVGSHLQSSLFPTVPAVPVMSDDNQSLFNPPRLNDGESEMAANEEGPDGPSVEEATDAEGDHKAEEDPTADPAAAQDGGSAPKAPDPDLEDQDTPHDLGYLRDPSEVLEADNFDPSSVAEMAINTDNLNSASWTAVEMGENSNLVKTFVVLEGHRVHLHCLEWDEQLQRQVNHAPCRRTLLRPYENLFKISEFLPRSKSWYKRMEVCLMRCGKKG